MTSSQSILKKIYNSGGRYGYALMPLLSVHVSVSAGTQQADFPLSVESRLYFSEDPAFGLTLNTEFDNYRLKIGGQSTLSEEQSSDSSRDASLELGLGRYFPVSEDFGLELGTGLAFKSLFVDYGVHYAVTDKVDLSAGYRFNFDEEEVNKNQFYTGVKIAIGWQQPQAEVVDAPVINEVQPDPAPKPEKEVPAVKPAPEPLLHHYTVKEGDYLYKIATSLDVPFDHLLEHNKFNNINLIYPDDTIRYYKYPQPG